MIVVDSFRLTPPPVPRYVATLVLGTYPSGPWNGASYVFDSAGGSGSTAADVGSYTPQTFAGISDGITQRCIRVTRSDALFFIDFRPDSPTSSRDEFVLYNGLCNTANPTRQAAINAAAANLGGFQLTVTRNGVQIFQAAFPQLGWFTSWRYQSAARPVVRTAAQLKAAKLVPWFDGATGATYGAIDCGNPGFFASPQSNYPNSPQYGHYPTYQGIASGGVDNPTGVNENCGIAPSMGGVGDRPDIGIVTEWAANHLANANANAFDSVRTHASVSGGLPWGPIDESTGSPVDMVVNFNAYFVNFGGGYQYFRPVGVPVPSTGQLWALEDSHNPSLSYLYYLMTGDPYALWNAQREANWGVLNNSSHRQDAYQQNSLDPASPLAPTGNVPNWYMVQTRSTGWQLRSMSEAYTASPVSPPSWLKPKSYFKAILDQNQALLDTYSTNNNNYPIIKTYGLSHLFCSEQDQQYQMAYLIFGLHFAVDLAGLSGWAAYRAYASPMLVGSANGISGWDNRMPAPYGFSLAPLSSSLDADPAPMATFADLYTYLIRTRYDQAHFNVQSAITQNGIPARQPNTPYFCNSWSVSIYAGIGGGTQSGAKPTVGDVLHLTVANTGTTGSPITFNHTVTLGDQAAISLGFSPFADDFVNQINMNANLAVRGITAAYTSADGHSWLNGNAGDGAEFFVNYNSAAIGAVTLSASITGSGPERIYVVPNGDVVTNDTDPDVYGRKRAWICGAGGTSGSGSGPTGTSSPQIDGTVSWYFLPELRAFGYYNAFDTTDWPAFPGFISSTYYVDELRSAMTTLTKAGVTGASVAMTELDAMVNWEYTTYNPSGHILWRSTLDARLGP